VKQSVRFYVCRSVKGLDSV